MIEAESPPLLAGRIQGVRAWDVLRGGTAGPPLLSSPSRGGYWPIGEELEAWCAACREPHDVPAPDCTCGFYAWHPWRMCSDEVTYWDFPDPDGRVMRLIEGWGRTELAADGFRSRFARPTALFLDSGSNEDQRRDVADLARHYGLEVVEVDGIAGLVEACSGLPSAIDPATVERLVLAEAPIEIRPDACGYRSKRGDMVGGSGYTLDCAVEEPRMWSTTWETTMPGVFVVRVAGAGRRPEALQDRAFEPGRELRLVPEPTNAADSNAIAVWDSEERLHAGYVPADLAGKIGSRLGSGQVRAVRSLWQWRDLRSGERTALHILISNSDRLVEHG